MQSSCCIRVGYSRLRPTKSIRGCGSKSVSTQHTHHRHRCSRVPSGSCVEALLLDAYGCSFDPLSPTDARHNFGRQQPFPYFARSVAVFSVRTLVQSCSLPSAILPLFFRSGQCLGGLFYSLQPDPSASYYTPVVLVYTYSKRNAELYRQLPPCSGTGWYILRCR